MSLQFQTLSQQWLFIDPAATPPVPVNPENLLPLTTYTIYLVVENPDPFEQSGVVTISSSAFGIGLLGATVATIDVTVPPTYDGIEGTETISFTYITAPGGHGCLGAVIEPGGAFISQNTTVNTVPFGVPATLSFVVYGGATPETMVLSLTEIVQGTSAVLPPGAPDSWSPVMIPPPGTGGPENLATATLTLNLAAEVYDSVKLQVTVPPASTETHVFHIVGTVNGAYVGEVDIVVHGQAGALPAPDPYIMGGYQSSDIILLNAANQPVPLGGQPLGRWDTLLQPDTDYGFQAIVHNDSPTDAVNTIVRFWSFPGGVGTAGSLIDVQSATIPGNGQVIVTSANPFRSAPPGQHVCAVVSIANAQSAFVSTDPSSAAAVGDPDTGGVANPHSGTAWRNSDSSWAIIGRPWVINLAASVAVAGHVKQPGPVDVQIGVTARQVPANFANHPDVVALRTALASVGAQSRAPLYLAPLLREDLPRVDLGVSVRSSKGEVHHADRRDAVHPGGTLPFTVSGTLPAGAKPGDVFLVEVSAQYHATKHHEARVVRHLQVLHAKA